MVNYALIENNVVTNVIVIDETMADLQKFLSSLGGTWVPISNAGIGYSYDPGTNSFTPPESPAQPTITLNPPGPVGGTN